MWVVAGCGPTVGDGIPGGSGVLVGRAVRLEAVEGSQDECKEKIEFINLSERFLARSSAFFVL